MARVTLQTIADEVGVSRMTVSNAFSRPDQLSAELRERILGAARQLRDAGRRPPPRTRPARRLVGPAPEPGCVAPAPAARPLAPGRTGSVGLLLNGLVSASFADAV